MAAPEIICPECRNPLFPPAPCACCGLPTELIGAVLDAATRRAAEAGALAARGRWQDAYDAAAESLSLSQRDNDLAALIILLAALAGAKGSVAVVPQVREEKLPAVVRPAAQAVLRLLQFRADQSPTTMHPSDSDLALARSALETRGPTSSTPHRVSRLWPAVAAVLAPLAVIIGWEAARLTSAPVVRPVPTPTLPADARTLGPIPDDVTEVRTLLEAHRLALGGQWCKALETLAPVPRERWPETSRTIVRNGARAAYRIGMARSRNGRYEEAAAFLYLATLDDTHPFFLDDAIYYRARALQRAGDTAAAIKGFEQLLADAHDSEYASEARRHLLFFESKEEQR